MTTDENSDSYEEQMAETIPTGSYEIDEALAEANDGMTIPMLADELGWTETEVEDVIQEMRNCGLIGPPPLGESIYIGSTDLTLAEVADNIGITIMEASEFFIEFIEEGLMDSVQISEYEFLLYRTEYGLEMARLLEDHFEHHD